MRSQTKPELLFNDCKGLRDRVAGLGLRVRVQDSLFRACNCRVHRTYRALVGFRVAVLGFRSCSPGDAGACHCSEGKLGSKGMETSSPGTTTAYLGYTHATLGSDRIAAARELSDQLAPCLTLCKPSLNPKPLSP